MESATMPMIAIELQLSGSMGGGRVPFFRLNFKLMCACVQAYPHYMMMIDL